MRVMLEIIKEIADFVGADDIEDLYEL